MNVKRMSTVQYRIPKYGGSTVPDHIPQGMTCRDRGRRAGSEEFWNVAVLIK